MRVADLIAYVNHDIDDATRAGMMKMSDLPTEPVEVLGGTSSARIARMVKDVVTETQVGGLTEIRMSGPVLDATLAMRSFLFDAVYENHAATAEFKKATASSAACGRRCATGPTTSWTGASSTQRTRRRGQGLPRRNDRPVRGDAVRAPLHPQALDRADHVESAIIDAPPVAHASLQRG